jgi:putative transposase
VKLWDEALAQQIYLGDQDFVARMQALVDPAHAKANAIPRAQRRAVPKPIEHYLARKNVDTAERDAGIFAASRGGYSLTAIASAVGLSITRVGRIVRRMEDGCEVKG